MGNGRVSGGIRSGVVHGDFSTAAAGDVVVPGPGDGLGLRVERYLEGKVQILGRQRRASGRSQEISRSRDARLPSGQAAYSTRSLSLRLLTDPNAILIRAVGTANEGHWARSGDLCR